MTGLLAFVVVVLSAVAFPAWAQVARVISGEHADFTRLVVELPGEVGWTVGRTPMGYAFAAQMDRQPGYDLSRVWDRIPRTRLQAIRVEPDSGALQLSLACSCHVFPFEYRPGMIVLDIRDGPAPPGSAFEAAFDLPEDPEKTDGPARPAPKGYDWLAVARSETVVDPVGELALPLQEMPVSLDPLREELLEQISRGAVEGVVEMELPGKPARIDPIDRGELPWARISVGEMPGLAIREGDSPVKGLTAEGGACIPDSTLGLAEWGAGRPPMELLVEARSGLYLEFDVVDRDAVLRAVRLHLYLGFGAEAAQYAALLDGGPEDVELAALRSLAHLIDGRQDPSTPFAGMLGCDGPAALWAAIAHDRLPKGEPVATDAILRNFVALPPHLRLALGAKLAEKLLDRGEADAARIIRNAMERGSESAGPEVALMDAKAELHADRPEAALVHAERVISDGGAGAESLITLVEAHFRNSEPMTPDVAEALQAFRGEIGDPAALARLDRALALALALSGQTAAALQHPLADQDVSDLWQVLWQRSPDDDFLSHAISGAHSAPRVSAQVALDVASRLQALGFPDAALDWLGPVGTGDAADRRRLAARAEAARGDARRVLALLDGLGDPQDASLRAEALVQLGAFEDAIRAYGAAGMDEEAERLRIWAGDWVNLTGATSPSWSAAAAMTEPMPPPEAGPLTRGAVLLDESAEVRQAMMSLLSEVEAPKPLSD